MPDQDLITYAREAASRGDDLFALLATDATASESDIRRAFRRKALTAHPDKAGDAYDPALYERLERARDVLLDPAAREAYDAGMRAILQKKMQLEQMSEKRRRLVEDLERREEEAKRAKYGPASMAESRVFDAERAAMAARGRAKMEEMRRLREEAEVRETLAREKEGRAAGFMGDKTFADNSRPYAPSTDGKPTPAWTPQDTQPTGPPPATDDDYDERIADLERRLKEAQQRKAEKKQRKAEKEQRKADKKANNSKAGAPAAKAAATAAATESRWRERSSHNNPPSPPPAAAESQADQDKVSDKPAAAEAAPSPAGGPPKTGSDRFASTMARLRAAQAAKVEKKRREEEEARRKAEEGAAATSGNA